MLTCPGTDVITGIDFASYGTGGGTCAGDLGINRACHALKSRDVLQLKCLGKHACTVIANAASGFDDPCPGTAKQLSARVHCGPSAPAHACATATDFSTATASCPMGAVMGPAITGNYGQPTGTCGNFKPGPFGITAKPTMNKKCQGSTTCSLFVSPATLKVADPAPGVVKTFAMDSVCENPPGIQACGMATNEGDNAIVTCPAGKIIVDIVFAEYGTPTGTCGAFNHSATCGKGDSLDRVRAECVGKSTCTVPSTYTWFGGDPCYGVYKHTYIQAACSE